MEVVIDPSRVRTLIVPIGRWKRNDFLEQVNDFRLNSEIRLVDITPLPDCIFNPQLFPHGRVLYSFIEEAIDNTSMMFLHDFEPYRKVFLVLGVCNDGSIAEADCLKRLKEKFSGAISFGVIYNCKTARELTKNAFDLCGESLETVMCDVTRNFLEALSTYYSSYKHVTLRSPGAIRGSSVLKTVLMGNQSMAGTNVKRILSQSKDSTSSSTISEQSAEKSKRYSALSPLSLTPNTSDKAAQRSRARQLKLLANFQLLAGHYTLSMSNFADAIKALHKLHDYIWLGNALEGIATCFKLLSYLQVPFQVPYIVQSLCPVSQASEGMLSPSSSRRSSTTSLSSPRNSMNPANTTTALYSTSINLPKFIKNIGDKILYYYNYSLLHSVEFTPQIVYCETILRTLKFMSLCYKGGGLTQNVLKELVFENNKLDACVDPDKKAEEYFSKNEVFCYSNKIFEVQLKSMEILEQVQVYSTLAGIYRNLGMMRKRAFVLRILFVSMLSQSSQLRNFSIAAKFDPLIEEILNEYSINNWKPELSVCDAQKQGWVTLQKNVLFLILRIYAGYDNHEKSLHVSEVLLKRFSHTLTKREQTDLLENEILPYKSESLTEYLDPFLLRDIFFESKQSIELPLVKPLTADKITAAKYTQTNQIFNPFIIPEKDSKKGAGVRMQCSTFFVSEVVKMKLTFQNPFKFNLKITDIQFKSNHREFIRFHDKKFMPVIVPPTSMLDYYFDIALDKATTSSLKIDELIISVFDLPSQSFKICKEKNPSTGQRYIPAIIPLEIMEPLPSLEIMGTNLLNNKLVILNGTKSFFKINLKNSSLSKQIDYLDISWNTDVESEFKAVKWAKMLPDDLYDADLQVNYLKNKILKFSKIPTPVGINENFTLECELDLTYLALNLNLVTITLQYGCRLIDNDQLVYVKSLSLPIQIFTKQVLEASSLSFIPITENFEIKSDISWINFFQSSSKSISDYILMLADIRNSSHDHVCFKLQFKDYMTEANLLDADDTRRYVIPVPKINLNLGEVHLKAKPVPRLDESKQFISSGLSASQECAMRERFWCREYILNNLVCHWNIEKQDISGTLSFRQFMEKFDSNMVNLLYPASNPYDIKLSASKTKARAGEVIELQVTVNSKDNLKLVPINFHVQDFFTGKSVLHENRKSILFQGQLCTSIKTSVPTHVNILPIKSGRYQLNLEISGILQLRQPLVIQVE